MNTSTIIDSYVTMENKFKDIGVASSEIGKIRTEINLNMNYVKKMYSIIFKNFVMNKIDTKLRYQLGTQYNQYNKGIYIIYFTKDGISTKSEEYGLNSTNISQETDVHFIKSFQKIKQEIEKVKPLLRENNYEKLVLFLSWFDLLIPDDTMNLCVKFSYRDNSNTIVHSEGISTDSNPFRIVFTFSTSDEQTWHTNENLDTVGSGLSDKLILEQTYDEVMEFMKQYKVREETRLKNLKEFVKIIDEQFKNYVILSELSTNGVKK